MVALPLLLAVRDLREVVPLIGLLAQAMNVFMVTCLHGHVQRGPMKVLLAAGLPWQSPAQAPG